MELYNEKKFRVGDIAKFRCRYTRSRVTSVAATRVLAQVRLHDDGVPGVLVRQ